MQSVQSSAVYEIGATAFDWRRLLGKQDHREQTYGQGARLLMLYLRQRVGKETVKGPALSANTPPPFPGTNK